VNEIRARPITREGFAPYGWVLDAPASGDRENFAAEVANLRGSARANLALARAPLLAPGERLTRMERHPFSTQAFLPLDVERYLVVGAPDRDGAPDMSRAEAFVVPGTVGVAYRANAWHRPMAVVAGAGVFAMLVHDDGGPDDTHWAEVEGPVLSW
jgi:ureidoglycolate hydrolase